MAQTAKDLAKKAKQNTGRAPATQTSLVQQVEQIGAQLGRVLPSHVTQDQMVRMTITEIKKNPKLGLCTKESFFGAVYDCAAMGLMPNAQLGHVYLIPYGTECTLVIGYKGLLELVYRSGKVDSIETTPVFENDEFQQVLGLNPTLHHIPAKGDRGELTHVYAVAWLKGLDKPRFEVMDRKQIDAIHNRSAAAKARTSPWKTDFVEMARKTALRRLCKTLPLSTEIQTSIAKDERISRYAPEVSEVPIDAGSIHDLDEIPAEEPVDITPTESVDEETGEITEQGGQGSLLD